MYPSKPSVKEIVKGSGFGRILKTNELLRVKPAISAK